MPLKVPAENFDPSKLGLGDYMRNFVLGPDANEDESQSIFPLRILIDIFTEQIVNRVLEHQLTSPQWIWRGRPTDLKPYVKAVCGDVGSPGLGDCHRLFAILSLQIGRASCRERVSECV